MADSFNLFKSKTTKSNAEIQEEKLISMQKTAQDWIPINDLLNGIVYRKDDYLVGYIRIMPLNLHLLSDDERYSVINNLASAFNGQKHAFDWYSIGRPVDLDSYLEWLSEKAEASNDFTRRKLLQNYMKTSTQFVFSGEITEIRFYMVIVQKNDNNAEMVLRERMNDVIYAFRECNMDANICSDNEITDLLKTFAEPHGAIYEKGFVDDMDFVLLKGDSI